MLQLDTAERVRRQVSPRIALKRKAELGQYMTLSGVARFMAGMFQPGNHEICRLLDAGVGLGAVSCAFLDRWLTGGINFAEVEATAYEIDARFSDHLKQLLASYSKVKAEVIEGDYIALTAVKGRARRFTQALSRCGHRPHSQVRRRPTRCNR